LYASVGGAAINHGVRLKRVADPGTHISDSGQRLKWIVPCPHIFLLTLRKISRPCDIFRKFIVNITSSTQI